MAVIAKVVILMIGMIIGVIIGKKLTETKYILVERVKGVTGPNCDISVSSIYFNGKVYNKPDPELVDEDHFFMPIKGMSLYINRKVIKKMYSDGTVCWDYNGYEPLTDREMKKAYTKAQMYCPLLD